SSARRLAPRSGIPSPDPVPPKAGPAPHPRSALPCSLPYLPPALNGLHCMAHEHEISDTLPCGYIRNAPCPDAILKQGLPLAGATVTDSAIRPVSSTMKDFVSDTVWLERSILLKASRIGVTTSLLTCSRLLTSPLVIWAWALAATKIAAAMNDAIVQSEDTNRNRRRTIVSSPPSRMRSKRASEKVKAHHRYNQTTILAVRCHRQKLATILFTRTRPRPAP